MNNCIDFIIAGAGLSGSVFARKMAEKGKKVLVIEKRNEVGGNVYDFVNEHGIIVQKYGPHIFHTSEKKIVDFISQYSKWQPFKLICEVNMLGKSTPSPFNLKTIDQFFSTEDGEILKKELRNCYPNLKTISIVDLLNSTNPIIKQYADFLYENDYSKYTAKQWGIDPEKIDINILKRVPIRLDYDEGYFSDTFEAIPINGFTFFIKNLLDHHNITVITNTNILDYISLDYQNQIIVLNHFPISNNTNIVYTGEIDTLFNYKFGRLPYRSLNFKFSTLEIDSYQNVPVVAYPQEKYFTRITEFKKITSQNIKNVTTIAYEYPIPFSPNDNFEPYYPILTNTSATQYMQYQTEAKQFNNLILCGRLAEFKYYNMDQAILRAIQISEQYN